MDPKQRRDEDYSVVMAFLKENRLSDKLGMTHEQLEAHKKTASLRPPHQMFPFQDLMDPYWGDGPIYTHPDDPTFVILLSLVAMTRGRGLSLPPRFHEDRGHGLRFEAASGQLIRCITMSSFYDMDSKGGWNRVPLAELVPHRLRHTIYGWPQLDPFQACILAQLLYHLQQISSAGEIYINALRANVLNDEEWRNIKPVLNMRPSRPEDEDMKAFGLERVALLVHLLRYVGFGLVEILYCQPQRSQAVASSGSGIGACIVHAKL